MKMISPGSEGKLVCMEQRVHSVWEPSLSQALNTMDAKSSEPTGGPGKSNVTCGGHAMRGGVPLPVRGIREGLPVKGSGSRGHQGQNGQAGWEEDNWAAKVQFRKCTQCVERKNRNYRSFGGAVRVRSTRPGGVRWHGSHRQRMDWKGLVVSLLWFMCVCYDNSSCSSENNRVLAIPRREPNSKQRHRKFISTKEQRVLLMDDSVF